MAWTVRTGTSTTYASRSSTTINKPTGTVDDDCLLLMMLTGASSEAPDPTASGFNLLTTRDVANGGFNVETRVYYKRAASEGASWTITHSTCSTQAFMLAIPGVDWATGPTDVTSVTNAGTAATTTWTGLSPVTAGTLLVGFSQDWGDSANNLTQPSGTTERIDVPLSYAWTEEIAGTGATGNRTHTNNNTFGASSGWGSHTIALRPASGATYTLDADAGSYAITGTAAGTQRNRLVDGAAGSYAITGTAAGTQLGRQVAALAGSYAIAGSDATFPKTWILDATAGSYSLTGTAAGLQVGHVLDATAGSYAISGQTAALTVGYQVAAGAGSYAVTGADATFPRTYLLDAGAGSYTVSGTDAALTIQSFGAYLLDADGGAYLISGQSAALLASHADLPADGGAYDITGSDAGLAYALVLDAAGGEYLFTGSPATLAYDGSAVVITKSGVSRLKTSRAVKPPKWRLPTEGPRDPETIDEPAEQEAAEERAEVQAEEVEAAMSAGFDPAIINEDFMQIAMLAGLS